MQKAEVKHFESVYPANSREREIGEVLAYVKKGLSCQVVGLPGVGQSTFLKLLSYNKNVKNLHLKGDVGKYHFVLINFSEVRRKQLIDVIKLILLSISDSLRERGLALEHKAILNIFNEAASSGDELVLFQSLKRTLDYLILERSLLVVLLMDRFEEYIPNLADDFFANLRILRNRGKNGFSVVFSLNRPLEELVEPVLIKDFAEYFIGNVTYLSLREDPILTLRLKQLEDLTGKVLSKEMKERIIFLTGGFGRLVKNSAQIILNNDFKASEPDGMSNILLSDPTIKAPLMDIWQALIPSEQDFLLTHKNEFKEDDLDYPYLKNVGLLSNGRLTMPLFETYIKRYLGEFEKKEEKEPIRFIADSLEIKKGEDTISDRLTALEFKLLKFLIDNKNMVISRDSIINAVWTNDVSTAGVTDQALDQLLLRLRRKVEDDPYLPKHILTVKGRGVRFTP